MQRLDWSLSRKVTQDIKTQPQINHYQPRPSFTIHLWSPPSVIPSLRSSLTLGPPSLRFMNEWNEDTRDTSE